MMMKTKKSRMWLEPRVYDFFMSQSPMINELLIAKGILLPVGNTNVSKPIDLPDFIPMMTTPQSKRKKGKQKKAKLQQPLCRLPLPTNTNLTVFGDKKAHEKANEWFKEMKQCYLDGRPHVRSLLVLDGPSGCGKTFLIQRMTAIHNINVLPVHAGENNLDIKKIAEELKETATGDTFDGIDRPTVLLIQDFGMCLRSIGAVICEVAERLSTIPRSARIAIELLPQDAYSRGSGEKSLYALLARQNHCEWIRMQKPNDYMCKNYLKHLNHQKKKASLSTSTEMINQIAYEAKGDMRQAEILSNWVELLPTTPPFLHSFLPLATDLDAAFVLRTYAQPIKNNDMLLVQAPRLVAKLGRSTAPWQVAQFYQSWITEGCLGFVVPAKTADLTSASAENYLELLYKEVVKDARNSQQPIPETLPISVIRDTFSHKSRDAHESTNFIHYIQEERMRNSFLVSTSSAAPEKETKKKKQDVFPAAAIDDTKYLRRDQQMDVMDGLAKLAEITSVADVSRYPEFAEVAITDAVAVARPLLTIMTQNNLWKSNISYQSLTQWIHPKLPSQHRKRRF